MKFKSKNREMTIDLSQEWLEKNSDGLVVQTFLELEKRVWKYINESLSNTIDQNTQNDFEIYRTLDIMEAEVDKILSLPKVSPELNRIVRFFMGIVQAIGATFVLSDSLSYGLYGTYVKYSYFRNEHDRDNASILVPLYFDLIDRKPINSEIELVINPTGEKLMLAITNKAELDFVYTLNQSNAMLGNLLWLVQIGQNHSRSFSNIEDKVKQSIKSLAQDAKWYFKKHPGSKQIVENFIKTNTNM